MKKRKLAVAVGICAMTFIISGMTCLAAEPRQIVRVAFPLQDGFAQQDENGTLSGYSYEYMERIAQVNGWELEYQVFDEEDTNVNLMNALTAVQNGEADVLDTMLWSEELAEAFEFPEHNNGVVYDVLSSLMDNGEITETNYMTYSPLRIAVMEKAQVRNGELTTYLDGNNIAYELISCKTAEDQYQALMDQRADVMLRLSVNYTPDTRTIVSFAPRPYYMVTTKGNTELAKQINDAIYTVKDVYPYFEKTLQEKYFGDVRSDFYLTEAEENFFADKNVIRVLCTVDAAPFVFLDQEGEPCGIAVSILEDFAREVGITAEYEIFDRSQDFTMVLQNGNFDCVLGIPINEEYNSALGIATSNAYMSVDTVMYTNPASVNKLQREQVVALIKGTHADEKMIAKRIDYYDTTAECIKAVKSGKADRSYGNLRCVEYYSYSMYASLNMVILYGQESNMEISTLNTTDTTFLKVLNRYIAGISETKLYEYSSQSAAMNQKNGLETFARNNLVVSVIFSALFLSAIFATFLMLYVTGRMKSKNRQLIQANGAKSEFLARMSHDLRTPMNAVIGMAYLGIESKDISEAVSYFQKIHLSGEYLLGLINDTLDMNKIESDKMVINPEPYYSAEFIASINNIILSKAQEKNVIFHIQVIKDTEYAVLFDKLRIQQIFVNLLNNAVKFTPKEGEVDFILEVLSDKEEQACIQFVVKDNGIGMSETFQKKMFLPFEQERDDSQDQESGTGLGLPIVKSLVELMGGSISCESALGRGTVFTVLLYPRIARKVAADRKPLDNADETDKQPGSLKGKQILIVEDHPLNMEIARKLLLIKGMEVSCARNGLEAVEKFREAPVGFFQGILMDIRMPIMDGMEATKQIRSMERSDAKEIPIIAMTANAYEEDIRKSLEAGMTAHLAKPVEPTKLYETLASYI